MKGNLILLAYIVSIFYSASRQFNASSNNTAKIVQKDTYSSNGFSSTTLLNNYVAEEYAISLEIIPSNYTISGVTHILLNVFEFVSTIELKLVEQNLTEAQISSTDGLHRHDVEVKVVYHGIMFRGHFNPAYYLVTVRHQRNFGSAKNLALFTSPVMIPFTKPERLFPCATGYDEKAKVSVRLNSPTHKRVLTFNHLYFWEETCENALSIEGACTRFRPALQSPIKLSSLIFILYPSNHEYVGKRARVYCRETCSSKWEIIDTLEDVHDPNWDNATWTPHLKVIEGIASTVDNIRGLALVPAGNPDQSTLDGIEIKLKDFRLSAETVEAIRYRSLTWMTKKLPATIYEMLMETYDHDDHQSTAHHQIGKLGLSEASEPGRTATLRKASSPSTPASQKQGTTMTNVNEDNEGDGNENKAKRKTKAKCKRQRISKRRVRATTEST